MRWTWVGTRVLSAGLLVLASCNSAAEKYKPPPHPEQYAVPPQDDPRFSQPIRYPANVLNKDNPKKDSDSGDGQPPPSLRSPSRPGPVTPGSY